MPILMQPPWLMDAVNIISLVILIYFSALQLVLFALLSWGAARLIPPTGSAAPSLRIDRNIVRSTFALVAALRAEPRLWWGGLVISWFWLVGAVALALAPPLVKNALGGGEELVTAALAIFSVAIGIGAGLAAWLAAGRIVLTPTLAGAVLLGVFALDLGWTTLGATPGAGGLGVSDALGSGRILHVAVDLAGLAVAGGLFIVPAFAAVQFWAGAERRARVVAAVNVLNAAFMTISGIAVAVMQKGGLSPPVLFLVLGAANLAVALAIARTLPKTGDDTA